MSQIIINLNNNIVENEGEEEKQDKPKRDTTSKKSMVLINQAVELGFNLVKQSLEDSFQRHQSLYEDYIGQYTTRNMSSLLKKGATALLAVYAGGPIGAVAFATEEIFSSFNKYASALQQLNTTDYNTNFGRVRAGLVNNGRGTEN